jgi:hypothetical protein
VSIAIARRGRIRWMEVGVIIYFTGLFLRFSRLLVLG